jgi:hypothetical protein
MRFKVGLALLNLLQKFRLFDMIINKPLIVDAWIENCECVRKEDI